MTGNGGDTAAATRIAAVLGVLFSAAAAAATTAAPPAAVTPGAPTTSPGASGYVNPYTPPAGAAAKSPSNATDPPGSWELYPSPTTRTLFAADFVNTNDGWAVGDGIILRYQSGTWSVYYQSTRYYFQDVDMVSANDGWLVCFDFNEMDAEIWHWDGGIWTFFDAPGGTLYCVDMIDANDGWIGDNPTFLRFNGTSWVTDGFAPDSIDDIKMNSDTDGRAVAYHWIMKRTGNAWTQEASDNNWYLAGIFNRAPDSIWAVGEYVPSEKGLILKYTSGWETYKIFDTAYFIVALDFYNNGKGWCVGSKNQSPPFGGFIAYFDGSTWTEADCPTDKGLSEIKIVDNDNAWIVGESGVILKYKPNIAVTPSSLGRIKAAYHGR